MLFFLHLCLIEFLFSVLVFDFALRRTHRGRSLSVEAGTHNWVGLGGTSPLKVTATSLSAQVPSPPRVDEDVAREATEAASGEALWAMLTSSSTRPPSPLIGDEEDLFSSANFFSSSIPAFTPLVGVDMAVKPSAL